MLQKIIIAIGFVFLFSSVSTAQLSLRSKLRRMELGKTTLAEIKTLFGEPDAVETISSWAIGKSANNRVDYYLASSQLARNIKNPLIRNINTYSYTKLGLKFLMFDNPWELYSLEITNPHLWSHGIRVGDSLVTVEKIHGENGDWLTSGVRTDYDLEYNKLGVQFGFLNISTLLNFSIKQKRKAFVTSIKLFDRRVRFFG